jgi:hypothetical protein
MAAAEQHVEEWVFRYTSEGDAKARASADQLTGSLDKLSGAQDRSAASNDKGIAASDRAARAKASQEAAAAKLQRQIEAENRALAASEAAQNAAAAATGGLTASQLRAIDAYAAATRAGNDNAAAVDRLFAANTDTDTLAGQLAAFDRRSAQERLEEAKAGGEAMTSLEAAQAAERLKVIEDFNKQAKAAFDDFANTIKKFLEQMLAGSSSPLSPEARLQAAQTQYDEQLKLAQGGDKTALGGITGYAQSLLDAGKVYYASSQAFQDIFQQIYDQLGKLPDQVGQKAFGDTGSATGGSALSNSVTSMIAAQYASSAGAANDVGPAAPTATPRVAVPVNQDAALLAELKAIGARLDALRDDVKENTGVDEEVRMRPADKPENKKLNETWSVENRQTDAELNIMVTVEDEKGQFKIGEEYDITWSKVAARK